jgi:hypothetical protein
MGNGPDDALPMDDAVPIADPVVEDPPIGPPYAGAADTGVVSSVGEHHPQALDAVAFLESEHRKLLTVLDEVLDQLGREGVEAVRVRWGGVVREALEHAAAEERVVWEVLSPEIAASARQQQQLLRQRLEEQDAFNPDVTADQVMATVDVIKGHVSATDDLVLPDLRRLSPARLMALGEDLRQVMG